MRFRKASGCSEELESWFIDKYLEKNGNNFVRKKALVLSHKTQQTLTFWFYFSRKRFLCVIKWVQAVAAFISLIVSGIGWTSVSSIQGTHQPIISNGCANGLCAILLFLEFEINVVPCGLDCYRVAKQRNKTRLEIILVFTVLWVLQKS